MAGETHYFIVYRSYLLLLKCRSVRFVLTWPWAAWLPRFLYKSPSCTLLDLQTPSKVLVLLAIYSFTHLCVWPVRPEPLFRPLPIYILRYLPICSYRYLPNHPLAPNSTSLSERTCTSTWIQCPPEFNVRLNPMSASWHRLLNGSSCGH